VAPGDGHGPDPIASGASGSGALAGIRVVEAGLLVQGPQASATLAEWGAEVVKVELPGFGDLSRWLPIGPDEPRSAYFESCNRGKRSLTLDLRRPGGRDVMLDLVDRADVLISNFTPGTMEGWGLGYAEVSARNPRLVYAAGSTYGALGPDAPTPGADLSGQAAGGLVSTTGTTGGSAGPVGATIADHIGAQNLVAGVLAALVARGRTGLGQAVTTSLVGGQIWAQAAEYTACLVSGRPAGPADRSHPLVPTLYGVFPTADGAIALVGVAGRARRRFFELIGHPDLEERFPQPLYWADTKAALFPLLDEVFRTDTTAGWCDRLGAAEVRCAPVRDHAAVVADPGVWENGYLVLADCPDGPVPVVAVPVGFSGTPARPDGHVPSLGEHTDRILAELGYPPDQVDQLRRDGVV